jgi:hypothetical protein
MLRASKLALPAQYALEQLVPHPLLSWREIRAIWRVRAAAPAEGVHSSSRETFLSRRSPMPLQRGRKKLSVSSRVRVRVRVRKLSKFRVRVRVRVRVRPVSSMGEGKARRGCDSRTEKLLSR